MEVIVQRKLYFLPAEGRQVPHPKTRAIVPAGGQWIFDDPYWHRRAADGDGCLSEAMPEGVAPHPED